MFLSPQNFAAPAFEFSVEQTFVLSPQDCAALPLALLLRQYCYSTACCRQAELSLACSAAAWSGLWEPSPRSAARRAARRRVHTHPRRQTRPAPAAHCTAAPPEAKRPTEAPAPLNCHFTEKALPRPPSLPPRSFSKDENYQSAPGSRVGTPAYLAPEVITNVHGQSYDAKVCGRGLGGSWGFLGVLSKGMRGLWDSWRVPRTQRTLVGASGVLSKGMRLLGLPI